MDFPIHGQPLVAVGVEHAIAVAAKNSGVCATTKANKPNVSDVSKQTPPAALASPSVPEDRPDLMHLALKREEAMAARNQDKAAWPRGPQQAITLVFLTVN